MSLIRVEERGFGEHKNFQLNVNSHESEVEYELSIARGLKARTAKRLLAAGAKVRNDTAFAGGTVALDRKFRGYKAKERAADGVVTVKISKAVLVTFDQRAIEQHVCHTNKTLTLAASCAFSCMIDTISQSTTDLVGASSRLKLSITSDHSAQSNCLQSARNTFVIIKIFETSVEACGSLPVIAHVFDQQLRRVGEVICR